MPRYEFQTTPSGGRRFVRIEHGPLKKAVPKAVEAVVEPVRVAQTRVVAEPVTVPDDSAMVINPPDPPVVAAVDLAPAVKPVVSDAVIKVPRTRRTTKKSNG